MIWAALALVVGLCLAAVFVWAVMGPATGILLESVGAIEVSPERAPTAYAAPSELARVAGLPRPLLYVAPGPHATGAAVRRKPPGAVAVSEAAFDILTEAELRGLLALLVAALAVGGARQPVPRQEQWFATDRLAATLAGPQTVVDVLRALMRFESKVSAPQALPFAGFVWATVARLNGWVPGAYSSEPMMAARLAALTVDAVPESAPQGVSRTGAR